MVAYLYKKYSIAWRKYVNYLQNQQMTRDIKFNWLKQKEQIFLTLIEIS